MDCEFGSDAWPYPDINFSNLSDMSPEDIAEIIFSKRPKEPSSCQLLAGSEAADLSYVFEIMVIILLEGMEIIFGDLSECDQTTLSMPRIMKLKPWINSLGYDLKISEADDTRHDVPHYCKILLNDKLHGTLFEMKKITKNYHFLLNSDHANIAKNAKTLSDLVGLLILKDRPLRISFDFLAPFCY